MHLRTPWFGQPITPKALVQKVDDLYAALDPSAWELSAPSYTCRLHPCTATVDSGENPTPPL